MLKDAESLARVWQPATGLKAATESSVSLAVVGASHSALKDSGSSERFLRSVPREVYSKDGMVGFLRCATEAEWIAVQQPFVGILESRLLPAAMLGALIVSSRSSFSRQEAGQDEPRGPVDVMRKAPTGVAELAGPLLAGMSPKPEAGQLGRDL